MHKGDGTFSQGLIGALVVGLLAAGVYLGVLEAQRGAGVADGTLAPAFRLEKYGGGTVSLEEQRGKVVLLDFWATWCPPCVEEMPSLVKLAQEYESQGLVFLAANRDEESEQKAAVGVFVAREVPDLGRYVVFADDPVIARYRVESFPTWFLIDRQGRIIDSASGWMSEDSLRRRIERALAQ